MLHLACYISIVTYERTTKSITKLAWFCRDRGRIEEGRGPCACPPRYTIYLDFVTQTNHPRTRDRHKAPSSTRPFPLSLQHAAAFIAGFGRKKSSGNRLASFA